MKTHMTSAHPRIDLNPPSEPSTSTSSGNRKRDSTGSVKIFDVNRTKKDREELLQLTLPDYVKAKTTLAFDSEKAQRYHKSVLEMMVLDCVPWTEVNKPGFLRHHHTLVPNFKLASEKYYRSKLDDMYDGIKTSLLKKLDSEAPTTISIGCDAWSQFHNGYMGINCHYLTSEWNRVTFCLACAPFSESHTGKSFHFRHLQYPRSISV